MVQLSLTSSKGKSALRFFPHSGYLGVSPVSCAGVVRTRLDEDEKPLPCKSITVSVRCYESRIGRIAATHSNLLVDISQTLWTKPDHQDYDELANTELPFRIDIPATVGGFSTALFVEYRCIWRIEAVLNHAPISGVGDRQIKAYLLPLTRYDVPQFSPTPTFIFPPLLQKTCKPGAPSVRYTVNSPTHPIGPLDILSLPIYISPLHPSTVVRSATATVERRIQFVHSNVGEHPSSTNGSLHPPTSVSINTIAPDLSPTASAEHLLPHFTHHNMSMNTLTTESSNDTITPLTGYASSLTPTPSQSSLPPYDSLPLTQQSSPPFAPSAIIAQITSTESSGPFSFDFERGLFSKTLTMQWPEAKPNSRWAIGETIHSNLVSVRFYVRIRIVVSSSNPVPSYNLELEENELLIVSTNESERELALSKYNDVVASHEQTRSKSKSPRRSRRDTDAASTTAPPIPSTSPVEQPAFTHKPSTSTIQPTRSSPNTKRGKSSRRPHTSSGVVHRPGSFISSPPPEKTGTFPKRWVSATATVNLNGAATSSSSSMHVETPKTQSLRGYKSFFGANYSGPSTRQSSTPNGHSSAHIGDSSASMSDDSISKSDRSDMDDEDESRTRKRLWARGRPKEKETTAVHGDRSARARSSNRLGDEDERSAHMKAWEEELARIEMTSKRSSKNMLGFLTTRKRANTRATDQL